MLKLGLLLGGGIAIDVQKHFAIKKDSLSNSIWSVFLTTNGSITELKLSLDFYNFIRVFKTASSLHEIEIPIVFLAVSTPIRFQKAPFSKNSVLIILVWTEGKNASKCMRLHVKTNTLRCCFAFRSHYYD